MLNNSLIVVGKDKWSFCGNPDHCLRVAIIIINFKSHQDTLACIGSIINNENGSDISYKIFIIDNHSDDGSAELIQSTFPNVIVIKLPRNLGFAGANNKGIISSIDADFFFLLNNDTIYHSNTIGKMVEVFKNDHRIGVVGATILDFSNQKMIDNMGAKINYFTGSSTFIANGEVFRNNREDIDVDYVCGAAMMIKQEVIREVGLLPEYYFLYGEEKEYCVRAKKKGYRIVNSGKATIVHKTSSTVKKYSGLKNYYFHRNRFIFLRSYAKTYQYLAAIIHSMVLLLPLYTIRYTIQSRKTPKAGLNELYNFLLGIFDGIRNKTGYTKKVN